MFAQNQKHIIPGSKNSKSKYCSVLLTGGREQQNWYLFTWKCHSITSGSLTAPPGGLQRIHSIKGLVRFGHKNDLV